MIKPSIIALAAALLVGTTRAEEPPPAATPWAKLEIRLDALKTWGTKHYTYSAVEPGGKKTTVFGKVSLSTELTDDAVILKDQYQISHRGETLSLEIVHTCRKDNFLSPVKIESKGAGSDEVASFVATVAEGKATIRAADGKERIDKLPEGTITTAAMMRLVTLLPQTPGKTYTFDYSLESEEMNLKEKYTLEVLPVEPLTIGSDEVAYTKFKLSGGGIHPVYYWVNKTGVLQLVMIDERKLLQLKETP